MRLPQSIETIDPIETHLETKLILPQITIIAPYSGSHRRTKDGRDVGALTLDQASSVVVRHQRIIRAKLTHPTNRARLKLEHVAVAAHRVVFVTVVVAEGSLKLPASLVDARRAIDLEVAAREDLSDAGWVWIELDFMRDVGVEGLDLLSSMHLCEWLMIRSLPSCTVISTVR